MSITILNRPRAKSLRVSACQTHSRSPIHSNFCLDEKEDTGKPVIRLFGVNAQGNSICAHVHNFTAYFYIHIIEAGIDLNSEQIEQFRINLNQ